MRSEQRPLFGYLRARAGMPFGPWPAQCGSPLSSGAGRGRRPAASVQSARGVGNDQRINRRSDGVMRGPRGSCPNACRNDAPCSRSRRSGQFRQGSVNRRLSLRWFDPTPKTQHRGKVRQLPGVGLAMAYRGRHERPADRRTVRGDPHRGARRRGPLSTPRSNAASPGSQANSWYPSSSATFRQSRPGIRTAPWPS